MSQQMQQVMGVPIATQGAPNIHQETMVPGCVLQPYNNQSGWRPMYPYSIYPQGIFSGNMYQQGVTANPNGVYFRSQVHPSNFASSQHQGTIPLMNPFMSQQVENCTSLQVLLAQQHSAQKKK
ncbi:hypothetical protein MKW92_009539 [Papaver armeniacum]|nr:hypothetical protein MKW92_009539 [Papaver armeniacum]